MSARTLVGTTAYGNAVSLNGSSQYLSRAIVSTVTNNITMSAWIKLTAITGSNQHFFQNGASDGNGYILMVKSTTGKIRIDLSFVAGLDSTSAITPGVWTHVACVRNAGTWQLYINGVADGGTIGNGPNSPSTNTTIGASKTSGGVAGSFFGGLMDDVRFYERALSAAEIAALYNYGIDINNGDVNSSNLKMWYKLDETSGNAADSSGGGFTLTNTGTATYTTGQVMTVHTPLLSFDSFLYDGVSQYADIPDNAAYSIPTTGALTVSIWAKPYTNQFTKYEGSGYVNFFGKSDFGSPNHVEWQMRLYNLTNTETDMRNNESSFYVFNSTGGTGVSSDFRKETTDVNRWNHYVGIADGTYVYLYKNGVLQEIAQYSGTITPADTIAKLYVAHADNNGYFYGEIGPIKIWNRVLGFTEIDEQYRLNKNNTNGLVGHWIADSANNRLSDQTATANHGTLRNNPTFVQNACVLARPVIPQRRTLLNAKEAIFASASSQYFSIAHASQIGLDLGTQDFIITGTVKTNALTATQTILAKSDTGHTDPGSAGSTGYDVIFSTNSGGIIQFRARSGGSNQSISAPWPNDGKRHSFAVVFKRGGSGRCQLWVDGQLQNSFSSFAADLNNDGLFTIGTRSGSSRANYLNGSLHNLHIYAWPAGTMPDDYLQIIDDVHYRKISGYTNGLVSRWSFNNTPNDAVGSNNLTSTNSPTYSDLPTRTAIS